MRIASAVIVLLAAALMGCGKASQTSGEGAYGLGAALESPSFTDIVTARSPSEEMRAFDVKTPAASPETARASGSQIAYTYSIGYRLSEANVAPVQARHTEMCRDAGSTRCIVLNSSIDREDHENTSALTELVVDARLATAFGRRLDSTVSGAGGSVGNRRTEAEDVTKQVIDADAKVRAKEALAERLLALIRTANGRVSDLVAAEKAYADTQEELAATRSLQAALRQRVAMSRYTISYSSTEAIGALSPIRYAVSKAGATIGTSLGALVTFVLVTLPWIITLTGLIWVLRRFGVQNPITRWRARRATPPAA